MKLTANISKINTNKWNNQLLETDKNMKSLIDTQFRLYNTYLFWSYILSILVLEKRKAVISFKFHQFFLFTVQDVNN